MSELEKFVAESNDTIVATHDGAVVGRTGTWAAGFETDVIAAALRVLAAAGGVLPPKQGLKRVSATIPGSSVGYIITLDKERIYVARVSSAAGT
jgi:hypothetical protein